MNPCRDEAIQVYRCPGCDSPMVVFQPEHLPAGAAIVFRAMCQMKPRRLKKDADINARELVGRCETCLYIKRFGELPVPFQGSTAQDIADFAQAAIPSVITFTTEEGRSAKPAKLAGSAGLTRQSFLLRAPRELEDYLIQVLEFVTSKVLA